MFSGTDTSYHQLIDAGMQIIDASADPRAIIEEACSLSKKIKLEEEEEGDEENEFSSSESTVERFLNVTCQSYIGEYGLSEPGLANQVIQLSQECTQEDGPLLNQSIMEKFQSFMGDLKTSMKDFNNDRWIFMSMVKKHDLPLEIVWNLCKAGALNWETYVSSKMCEASFSQELVQQLVMLCRGSTATHRRRQDILSGFTSFLMAEGFGEGKSSYKGICRQILDDILQKILDLSLTPEELDSIALPTAFMSLQENISLETVKRYSLHALSYILSNKASFTVSNCLKTQRDWKTVQVHGIVRTVLKQLFLPLECKEVLGVLTRSLDQKISGTTTLTFLSVMYISFTEAAKLMSGYIKHNLASGLDSSNKHDMSVAFLMARLSAVAGPHCCQSYAEWFKNMFDGSSQALATNRPTFKGLVNFLSSLVPFESAQYLKDHIVKRPNIPPKCRDLYADYVALAKTRLTDLKADVCDIQRLYDDEIKSDEDTDKTKESVDLAEKDVERALGAFAETKKIPTAIIEASIFRRPYFFGKFLPALMKPRILPDEPDLRMRLIEEIKNSNKIPYTLYLQYKDNCEREKRSLLEGVFDVDDEDDDLEAMALAPLEQLSHRLNSYFKAVCSGKEKRISECLKAVLDLVNSVLPASKYPSADQSSSDAAPISVDLLHPHGEELPQQVVAIFMKHLAHLVKTWRRMCRRQEDGTVMMRAIDRLISQFNQQCAHLRPLLFTDILAYCSSRPPNPAPPLDDWAFQEYMEGSELMDPERKIPSFGGPAAVCANLMGSPIHMNQPVLLKSKGPVGAPRSTSHENILHAAIHCFGPDIGRSQEFMLSFCYSYINLTLAQLDDDEKQRREADVIELDGPHTVTEQNLFPDIIIQRTFLLWKRLGPSEQRQLAARVNKEKGKRLPLTDPLFSSPRWKRLCEAHPLTLRAWIDFELLVGPKKDVLSLAERATYLWEMSVHLLKSTRHSGDGASYCCEMLGILAHYHGKSTRADLPVHEEFYECLTSFAQLLRRHLLQLPPSAEGEKSWLASTLGALSSHTYRNSVLRLIMDLPTHLIFCNCAHEKLIKVHLDSAMAVIQHFSDSSQNMGGFLPLDVTVYLLQGYVWAKHGGLSESDLTVMLSNFLVTVSILKHKGSLEDLGLLKELPSGWTTLVTGALQWAHNVANTGRNCKTDQNIPASLKGAALFVVVYDRESEVIFTDKFLKSDGEIFLHFLELAAVYLTINEKLRETSVLSKASIQIIKRNSDVLCQLLTLPATGLSPLHLILGLGNLSWMMRFRDLHILRLAMYVPGYLLLRRASNNLTLAVVNAYIRIQQYSRGNKDRYLEIHLDGTGTSIFSWLQLMVKHTSDECMSQIVVPNITEPGMDTFLYKYIEEKKTGW